MPPRSRGEKNAVTEMSISLLRASSSPSSGRFAAQIAAGLSCVLGATALAGWWLKIDILRCIIPGSTPLKPNVAAGFLLSGIILWLSSRNNLSKAAQMFVGAGAALIVALGALTLAEYFFNWDLGIDRWLVRDFPAAM